jgi:hypothetical protein
MKVIALAFKEGMLFDVQHNVEITRRTAVEPTFTQPCEAYASSVFHSSGNFGVNRFLTQHSTFPFALGARISYYRSSSLASRTSTRDAEEALLITNLTLPIAGAAGNWSLSSRSARSVTILTSLMAANSDRRLRPKYSLFKL